MNTSRNLRFNNGYWSRCSFSIYLLLLVFFIVAVLFSCDVKADGPDYRPPAVSPLDKEQDLLDKQRLEEKITRELQEQRRRVEEEKKNKDKQKTIDAPDKGSDAKSGL